MPRLLAVGALAGCVVVLAVPGPRRALAWAVDGLRGRVATFRADMATREAELRAGLLPPDDAVAAARSARAARAMGAVTPAARPDGASGAHGATSLDGASRP